MTPSDIDGGRSEVGSSFPRWVAIVGGIGFVALGVWAMVDPGVGVAAALHTVSHIVGRDLGGVPEREIPSFAGFALILLAAGGLRWRHVRGAGR